MTQQRSGDGVLSLGEVAETFGVRTRTIQRWVKARQFPQPLRPGGAHGRPFWSKRDIELYIAAGGIHAYRREKRRA